MQYGVVNTLYVCVCVCVRMVCVLAYDNPCAFVVVAAAVVDFPSNAHCAKATTTRANMPTHL